MKHKIKGDIISWNSSIWDFNNKMKTIKEDDDIDLEINSYGGDVFLGIDLMNTLRGHKGKVTVTITGIAASAASVIVMGADVIRAYSNTQLMLHNAWTYAVGNAKELRKVADDLDSIGESVLACYTHRIDEDEAKKLLDDETYLSAKKALEKGLIDEIVDSKPEEVESSIFENKAKEFNNQISKPALSQPAVASASIDAETLKQMFTEFKNEIKNDFKPKEEPAPKPAEPKQNMSSLFLHLKGE
ncbi:Clp protease ClpP [Sutcliffiella horikoshii]|uniref:ATP-dependent Clp protease proteolytic subunit n=1 Tax=Sutcliffiella horikoshii TaxID=79883 RepID=A0A5D4SUM9_9BACI|nr:head maturation protease, ClpP-related [Sutcliffiella horikoshii]TYS67050.1 Clp protease ClpP [Sutcliffiella horikoshii]